MALNLFALRRRMTPVALALSMGVFAGLGSACANNKDEGAGEEVEWPEKLSKYERTGEYENCLRSTRIKSTRIIDRQHILFDTRGGDTYVNQLPRPCVGLTSSRAISYSTEIAQLCSNEIITVIDPSSPVARYGSCGLSPFEKVIEKEAEQE